MEGRPRTSLEQDRVLAQGRGSGECPRLTSDIYLSLTVWYCNNPTLVWLVMRQVTNYLRIFC